MLSTSTLVSPPRPHSPLSLSSLINPARNIFPSRPCTLSLLHTSNNNLSVTGAPSLSLVLLYTTSRLRAPRCSPQPRRRCPLFQTVLPDSDVIQPQAVLPNPHVIIKPHALLISGSLIHTLPGMSWHGILYSSSLDPPST